MLKFTLIFCVTALVLLSSPVLAAERKPGDDPERLLENATRQIMRALELMVNAIPQYRMPEVLDNGDIIIRRVRPTPKPARPTPKESDKATETST